MRTVNGNQWSATADRKCGARRARRFNVRPSWRDQTFQPLLAFVSSIHAQYAIDWFNVAGVGGTSTNGQYSLSGTVGQQDAGGPMPTKFYRLF